MYSEKYGESRFQLKEEGGNNPLVVIGVNPSTATNKKLDFTVTKVMEYAERNDFDSFIILNVYP